MNNLPGGKNGRPSKKEKIQVLLIENSEPSVAETTETSGEANVCTWWSLCLERRGQSRHNSSFYRSGRAMPGLTGGIIGRAGGRIM